MKANWFLSDDAPQFQRVFVLICVNMLKGYNMDIYYIYIYLSTYVCDTIDTIDLRLHT
jgi:hypothetical protein